jgi:hypothetical protein
MIVGFTGSRSGMPEAQLQAVSRLLDTLDGDEFHHGGCIGADVAAAFWARVHGYQTFRHPGDTPDKQDKRFVDDVVFDVLPNLVRNHKIVDVADFLIAAPDGPERQRSGTWATIRYARSWRVPLTIVMPDGSM